MLLLPLAASNLSARAAPAAQEDQPVDSDTDLVILKEVKDPDGTTTVTMRIYASANDPDAPNTNFYLSQDTYIASGISTGNYGSATNLAIGYNSSGPQAMRMLLQFNLSSIPLYSTVNSATVYVYQYAASGIANMGFQAQYAVSPWNEYNATWDNANYLGGSPLPVGNFPSTLGWLSFNSTNLFQSWVNSSEPNYGLIITGNEDPAANSSRYFYSSNAGGNRPYVDINYTTGCAYTTPPTSSVNPLPADSPSAFTVSWTGAAYTPPGCATNGISSYIVWYQVNNGDFVKWLDGVPYTSATFNAASLGIGNGSLVGFRSQAIDNYGNKTPAGNATASTTINAVNPTAAMNPLPTWTNTANFVVSWTGNAQGGPPITSYNLQVNVNNGGWQTPFLLSNTPQTSYQYSGANGSNYQFRVQASNNNGASFGPWSGATSTTVDTSPPSTTMTPLPQYTTSTSFWVSWSGTDSGSGIGSYNVQYQLNDGAWQPLISNTPQTSFYVQNAQTGQDWGFRVQAIDKAGNAQPWPANAQTSTVIFANPIAAVQPFNPPILQSTAPVTNSFPVKWLAATPPGTFLTTVTISYSFNSGAWTTWNTFPASPGQATFNWVNTGLGDGIYRFKATAANNVGEPPFELPESYWQSIIVDMAGKYQVRAYLPIVMNNATP
jgi:hypothetical protein